MPKESLDFDSLPLFHILAHTCYTQRIIYKLRTALERRESRLIDQVSVIMHLRFNACMGLLTF